MKVENGKTISFFYTLKVARNNRLLQCRLEKPLEIIVGKSKFMFGLDKKLIGLEQGEKKTIRIEPEDGYGLRDDKYILSVNRSEIPDRIRLHKGFTLKRTKKSGKVMKGHVLSFNEHTVLIDCNHPLAGEVLKFEAEIYTVSGPKSN